jgi:hypothetical protein
MLPVLRKVWSSTQFIEHSWWEQAALMTEMGYSSAVEPVQHVTDTALFFGARSSWL